VGLHKEIAFEDEVCAWLGAHQWLYEQGAAAAYDRARALFPADVIAWIKTSQPKAWEALAASQGAAAEALLLDRLRKQLDDRGTLDVLRHGIEVIGLKAPLLLAQFRPALGANADILARYQANRPRVVRQVKYSLHNENCIDLVLFLNGIPVATAEMKTDFTQSVDDAVDQYRFDRQSRPKGQSAAEPLLEFPRGALVHFAVSNSEVRMTTRLAGPQTQFLPFNQGDRGAAGNPVNPQGHRTAYLWQQVWERESWLEILGRYLVAPRDEYRILLVANKFQTGFDQPLLCGMYVDKRLAGIQAVQTLSRLNRAWPGKDTTYILDFVNAPEDVLAAFKTYHDTAELAGVTDPNLVYDLRAKLDALGYYDEHEVERVVRAELDPRGTQGALSAAIEPVADRLLKRFAAARRALAAAPDKTAEQAARNEMDALAMFRRDLATFVRVHAFLWQIFDYGNTALEKRAIFFKRLLPLLEFGREREVVDLSLVVLTHHKLRNRGDASLNLYPGVPEKLQPLGEAGSGEVREPERARLSEIITRVNDLFEGELTDDDKLVYVNSVLKGKLLESGTLQAQARNNSKEQFANSPDLAQEILNAVMDALAAHTTMSQQALDSPKVRDGLKDILLGPAQLYESLQKMKPGGPAALTAAGPGQ
jgi:type I site-specific restriction-modification system R (restriction) subunit